MMQLYYYPGTAAMPVHILLEEIGAPFELVLVDRAKREHKAPEYLALNPNGLIPVLKAEGLVLYEAAAICLYLADRYPAAQLAPALGTNDRAQLYKWLLWLSNTLQATLLPYFYPERWVAAGNAEAAKQVKYQAQTRVASLLQQVDEQLRTQQQAGHEWFAGAQYSLLDPFVFTLCRWTRNFSGDAGPPARDFAHIGPYLQRVLLRPAVQRVFTTEKLIAPLV